jgi:SAM-dependent methyltransferase
MSETVSRYAPATSARTGTRTATHAVEVDPAGVRWPVVDGIAWRRTGRDEMRRRAVGLLDAGDIAAARVALLADADDWWDEPAPPPQQLARAAQAATMGEAMALLGLGRVGDYFAHRWSDPSYLAALALLQAHWPGDRPVVELACGAGHLLRELADRGVDDLVGVDVAFSKLWLAQRFVCPQARYVCADARNLPPVGVPTPAYVLCVDALYFLPDKPAVVTALQQVAGPGGSVVIGHAHTPAEVHSAGEPLTPGEYRQLLGTDLVYDDDALTDAFLTGQPPRRGASGQSRAVALVAGDPLVAGRDLRAPLAGRPLRLNPLYDAAGVRHWPSERWAQEYVRAGEYLPARVDPQALPADAAATRVLLDLPECW